MKRRSSFYLVFMLSLYSKLFCQNGGNDNAWQLANKYNDGTYHWDYSNLSVNSPLQVYLTDDSAIVVHFSSDTFCLGIKLTGDDVHYINSSNSICEPIDSLTEVYAAPLWDVCSETRRMGTQNPNWVGWPIRPGCLHFHGEEAEGRTPIRYPIYECRDSTQQLIKIWAQWEEYDYSLPNLPDHVREFAPPGEILVSFLLEKRIDQRRSTFEYLTSVLDDPYPQSEVSAIYVLPQPYGLAVLIAKGPYRDFIEFFFFPIQL